MTNLQKIKEACQKANSEIMELKFGCEIKAIASGARIYGKYLGDEVGDFIRVYTGDKYPYAVRGIVIQKKGDIEILGRPIRLADVLLAINQNQKSWFIWAGSGLFQRWDGTKNDFGSMMEKWNLKDDNLEHQNEETINFIAGLL